MGKHKKAGGGAGGGSAADDSALPISLRGKNMDSSAIAARIPSSSLAYNYPLGAETGGDHCYSHVGGDTFQVRGPDYLTDKVKVSSAPCMFDLMHADMFRSNDKIGNVAARHDSWLRAARTAGDTRYYLVIVYVTPAPPYLHLVFYYAVQPERVRANPHFAKLWQQFTAHGEEADAFRNERWKVIPRVSEGSWMVQRAVGTKPALLAQKLTHTWILCDGHPDVVAASRTSTTGGAGGASGGAGGGAGGSSGSSTGGVPATSSTSCGTTASMGMHYRGRGGSFTTQAGPGPYLEADCDVASSSMAYVLVSLLQTYARYLVIDLGFAIEPRSDEELPEAVLGSIRLSRVDVERPPMIAAEPGDWVLGTLGTCHGAGEEGAADAGGIKRSATVSGPGPDAPAEDEE